MAERSFWEDIGPGLLETGGNVFLGRRAAKEAEDRLRRAQGPLYGQMQDFAGRSLGLAQSMDPKTLGAERFAEQQKLLAPGMEADRLKLMAELQKKGMLGAASFAPVPGTVNTTGAPMNPQMAALLAAQEGAKARSAYESLGQGEQYLDQLLKRSGMLQGGAQQARATGQAAMGQIPAKPSITEQLLRGGMNILKDPRARDAILAGVKKLPGMLGDLGGWLGGGKTQDYFGNADFSFGF